MVGFRDFDGVGIAPVSNKMAVKYILSVELVKSFGRWAALVQNHGIS